MILVDASVWIEHFRSAQAALRVLLEDEQIAVHPFVIGEIACGHVREREGVRRDLEHLPAAVVAHHEEVLRLVDQQRLWGTGIGWIDAHLLASARLSHCSLWTFDTALQRAASMLGVLWPPPSRA